MLFVAKCFPFFSLYLSPLNICTCSFWRRGPRTQANNKQSCAYILYSNNSLVDGKGSQRGLLAFRRHCNSQGVSCKKMHNKEIIMQNCSYRQKKIFFYCHLLCERNFPILSSGEVFNYL